MNNASKGQRFLSVEGAGCKMVAFMNFPNEDFRNK